MLIWEVDWGLYLHAFMEITEDYFTVDWYWGSLFVWSILITSILIINQLYAGKAQFAQRSPQTAASASSWTNTWNLDKYFLQFGQIQFAQRSRQVLNWSEQTSAPWTNIFWNLEKDFCNLDKYSFRRDLGRFSTDQSRLQHRHFLSSWPPIAILHIVLLHWTLLLLCIFSSSIALCTMHSCISRIQPKCTAFECTQAVECTPQLIDINCTVWFSELPFCTVHCTVHCALYWLHASVCKSFADFAATEAIKVFLSIRSLFEAKWCAS